VKFEVRDVSEGSLLLEFPEAADPDANRAAISLASGFAERPPAGFFEAIPGARTLFLEFDPLLLPREKLLRRLERLASRPVEPSAESRVFRVPVAYGGVAAPDLETLARDRGMSPEDFARRHAESEYTVAFLGFSPGFAYLSGLAPELRAPRLETPRPRVAAGSVAIGGEYSAIYPAESPGGWRLIGRSPVQLFDAAADPPALLRAGDRVRFEPVGHDVLERAFPERRREDAHLETGRDFDLFETLAPGLFTSVQGAPRFGLGASGVPAGGAMDAGALARGHAALANPSGAAALEMTLSGPDLLALADALVCVTGGDLDARIKGEPAPLETPFRVAAGDRITFGYAASGARAYLCVEGGLAQRRPGEPPRRIARGDFVARARPGDPSPALSRVAPSRPPDRGVGALLLRVLPGPQKEFFPEAAMKTFLSATWRVTPESDRRGIRLDGPRVELARRADIPPEGTALGAIQVPGNGLPIALGPDRPVTGGYAKIATVVTADWSLLAQAPPGTPLRFRSVELGEALAELRGAAPTPVGTNNAG